jgi:hypothetical protein
MVDSYQTRDPPIAGLDNTFKWTLIEVFLKAILFVQPSAPPKLDLPKQRKVYWAYQGQED